jgi:hypothetical protein
VTYRTITTQLAIVPTTGPDTPCNPVFGERAVHVTLEDDGCGPFLSIRTSEGEIKVDPDELEVITAAARQLLAQEGVGDPET